eukprot:gene9474-19678_t
MRGINSDKKSVTSRISQSSNIGGTKKCLGDFCSYVIEDEYHLMELENDNSIKNEALRARQRHRRLTTKDKRDGNDDTDTWKEDDYLSEIDSNISSKDAVSRTVPFKSVVLARQEMDDLDEFLDLTNVIEINVKTAAVPWPESIKHWWLRVGHSSTTNRSISILPLGAGRTKKGNTSDTSNASDISESTSIINNSKSKKVTLGFTRQSQSAPTLKISSEFSTLSSISDGSKRAGHIPYDLHENSYANTNNTSLTSNLGHVSWYYSSIKVCERCFLIYSHINKFRDQSIARKERADDNKKNKNKHHMENRTRTSLSIFDQDQKREKDLQWEEMSATQRKLIDRLSQAKKVVEDVNDDGDKDVSNYTKVKTGKGSIGAPVALPPLPWQLHDHALREKYEQHQPSAFLKGMRNKAQQTAILAHHEKMIQNQQQSLRYTENDIRNGHYALNATTTNNDNDNDNNDQIKWEIAVGRRNNLNRSSIEGNRTVKSNKVKSIKKKKKNIDPSRLLHSWQRDMERIKKGLAPEEFVMKDEENDNEDEYEDEEVSNFNRYQNQNQNHSQNHNENNKHLLKRNNVSKNGVAAAASVSQGQGQGQSSSLAHTNSHSPTRQSQCQSQSQSLADFFTDQNKGKNALLPPLQQEPLVMSPENPQLAGGYLHSAGMTFRGGLSGGSAGLQSGGGSISSSNSYYSDKGNGYHGFENDTETESGADNTSLKTRDEYKPRSALSSHKSARKTVSFASYQEEESGQGGGGGDHSLPKSPSIKTRDHLAKASSSDEDEDDEDEEGIGWSPFDLVPTTRQDILENNENPLHVSPLKTQTPTSLDHNRQLPTSNPTHTAIKLLEQVSRNDPASYQGLIEFFRILHQKPIASRLI